MTSACGATTLAMLVAVVSSCGASEYSVDLAFNPQRLRAATVSAEVFVVTSCAAVMVPELPPSSLAQSTIRQGRMTVTLGRIAPGRVGLYARARDENCQVIAAGCNDFDVRARGSGALTVTLLATPSASSDCPASTACVVGMGVCDPTDAMPPAEDTTCADCGALDASDLDATDAMDGDDAGNDE